MKYELPLRPPGIAQWVLKSDSGTICQKCYDFNKSSALATRKELEERPGQTRQQQAATATFLRLTERKDHTAPRMHADARLVAARLEADADMDNAPGVLEADMEADAAMATVQPDQEPEPMVTDMQDAAQPQGPTDEPAPHKRVSEESVEPIRMSVVVHQPAHMHES